MKKGYIYTVIFMILLSGFFSTIVGFANSFYSDTIKKNEDLRLQKSILSSINVTVDENAIDAFFKNNIIKTEISSNNFYYTYIDENKKSIANIKEFSGPGLWGTIQGFISFDPAFTRIIGIDFTNHNETPGLGGRIDEPWFKNQFKNFVISKSTKIEFTPESGLDSITGATNTSNSVLNIFNKLIQDYTLE